jgi:hypothetical protein
MHETLRALAEILSLPSGGGVASLCQSRSFTAGNFFRRHFTQCRRFHVHFFSLENGDDQT